MASGASEVCIVKANEGGLVFIAPLRMICRLSTPLYELVESNQNSTDNALTLGGVDKDTFWRFFQFVYSGAYESPEMIEHGESTRSEATNNTVGFGGSGGSGSLFGGGQRLSNSFRLPYSLISYTNALDASVSSQVLSKRKRAALYDDEILGRHFEMQLHCTSLFLGKYKISKNKLRTGGSKTMPTVSAFLGHCRVWYFAYTYDIPTLMEYACTQLARELAHCVIHDSVFVHDFKALVHYVHNECTARDSSLRLLIARFAVCVIKDVSALEGWEGLLTDVPAFRSDLADELLQAMETP